MFSSIMTIFSCTHLNFYLLYLAQTLHPGWFLVVGVNNCCVVYPLLNYKMQHIYWPNSYDKFGLENSMIGGILISDFLSNLFRISWNLLRHLLSFTGLLILCTMLFLWQAKLIYVCIYIMVMKFFHSFVNLFI